MAGGTAVEGAQTMRTPSCRVDPQRQSSTEKLQKVEPRLTLRLMTRKMVCFCNTRPQQTSKSSKTYRNASTSWTWDFA